MCESRRLAQPACALLDDTTKARLAAIADDCSRPLKHILRARIVLLSGERLTAHGRFALQMHGAMAEYFLDLNRERTMEGLKAALARGRKGGRPKALSEGDLEVGRALLAAGNISVAEIAKRLGISRVTFYSYFPQARARSQARAAD